MAETLNVRDVYSKKEFTITDKEPLESAALFWKVSDRIWSQKPENYMMSVFSVGSELPVLEARDAINETLREIDEQKLVFSGIGKQIKLRGFRDDESVVLSPELLDNPVKAYVGTYNWDDRNTWRPATIKGKRTGLEFTDGHTDYHRELYAGLSFRDQDSNSINISYAMQRIQYSHDKPTSLSVSIWHSIFAETGYEGQGLGGADLSVEQELKVIRLIQNIGGITLNSIDQ